MFAFRRIVPVPLCPCQTRALYVLTLLTYLLTVAAAAAFALFQTSGIVALMSIIGFMGILGTAILVVGLEYAAEISYPIPEQLSSGVLNGLSQVWSQDCSTSINLHSSHTPIR